jgi:hypothetical protein
MKTGLTTQVVDAPPPTLPVAALAAVRHVERPR